jgi:hypothetical protein
MPREDRIVMTIPLTDKHTAFAMKLGKMNPAARSQALVQHLQNPEMAPHVQAIMSDPTHAALATGASTRGAGGSAGADDDQSGATDPSGAFNPNRALGFGGSQNQRRLHNMRHQILGFGAAALVSNGINQPVKAKPLVSFKGLRWVVSPLVIAAGVTLSTILVGTTNQTAGNTLFPCDVFGPASYAGDFDMSLCAPAIDISALANSANAVTWSGGIIGLVKGKPVRPQHTKVQALGLSPQQIPPNSTVSFSYNPQLDFVPRKIAITPGTAFGDNLTVNNVQCGQMLQTASPDPYCAALHSDLFPLDLDWDMISAAVSLQWTVTNPTNSPAIFQGVAHGDVDPAQLARAATAYV